MIAGKGRFPPQAFKTGAGKILMQSIITIMSASDFRLDLLLGRIPF